MKSTTKQRSEKEIIVMGLCLACFVCVGLFAAIRYFNQDYVLGTLDLVLASYSFFVFTVVYRTGKTEIPSLSMAIIGVLGTIATIILKGDGQIFWAYPTVALMFYLLPAKNALILWAIFTVVIVYLVIDLPAIKLIIILMSFLVTSFFCYLFSSKMHQMHDRLRRLANEDVLTYVRNRRAFNQHTVALNDTDNAISGILFDLDNFKQVNDYFGHSTGDDVLIQTTNFVNKMLNERDVLYRIGGDEFAILCDNSDFDYAYQLSKEIHQAYGKSQINQTHNVTLSMAVAQKENGEDINEWLGRLDSALYQAKRSGRNQIIKSIRH